MNRGPFLYAAISLAIIAISFGATLIRLAGDAPVLAIAAWRLSISFLLLAPALAPRRPLAGMGRTEFLLSVASGFFLSLHFISWILSLRYTSVASSVVLVSTSPIFVGLGSRFLLRERLSRPLIVAIALSVIGAAIIGWGDLRIGGRELLGDALAVGGAIMASAYFLLGRRVRRTTHLQSYLLTTYGSAAVFLLAGCLASSQPLFGFPAPTYLYLVLLAVGPQLIGHSTFNWALRYLSASTVAILTLGEPIGATIIAYLILGEAVTLVKGIGGGIILAGIYLSLRQERRSAALPSP
jgi:drug/metabolite transporter (DMT)-like permease